MPLKIGCVSHGKTSLMKAIIKELPEHPGIKIVEEPFDMVELKKIFNNVSCKTTHEAADTPQELVDKVRELTKIDSDKS